MEVIYLYTGKVVQDLQASKSKASIPDAGIVRAIAPTEICELQNDTYCALFCIGNFSYGFFIHIL